MVFVTDFDGTITEDDFFLYIKENVPGFKDLVDAPWQNYLDGKITHFNAITQMYATLRISESELISIVNKVNIDEWAVPTFKLLHEAQIPIYIASAGFNYYINILIGNEIEKFGATLVTNSSTYSQADGFILKRPPADSLFYDEGTGISKRRIVKHLQQSGKHVIFAGDGPPDYEPAQIADEVFAKKMLLDWCVKEGINTNLFDSYKDIYTYFEKELTKCEA